jgi:hypothetical protein
MDNLRMGDLLSKAPYRTSAPRALSIFVHAAERVAFLLLRETPLE